MGFLIKEKILVNPMFRESTSPTEGLAQVATNMAMGAVGPLLRCVEVHGKGMGHGSCGGEKDKEEERSKNLDDRKGQRVKRVAENNVKRKFQTAMQGGGEREEARVCG